MIIKKPVVLDGLLAGIKHAQAGLHTLDQALQLLGDFLLGERTSLAGHFLNGIKLPHHWKAYKYFK